MPEFPPFSAGVARAVSHENLETTASAAADPELLLGLAFLSSRGSRLRDAIADRRIAAVLALTMDGVDAGAVAELIRHDPDNALGYYLQASLFYASDQDDEALQAYRKAAHCSELRLYEEVTGGALFKALDALNLQGSDRLYALSWMACRSTNFNASVLQYLSAPLSEWGGRADTAGRQEMGELLLVLAGHLFATNFYNRWAARQALGLAIFGLKAEVPGAEKFPAARLVSTMLRWPPAEVAATPDEPHQRLRLAQYLPDRIHRAFAAIDPRQATNLCELNLQLSAERKRAGQKAAEHFVDTSRALIEVARTDPDGIMSPYLLGIIVTGRSADGRQIVPFETGVEKLLRTRPDLFAAASANEQAMKTLFDFGASDPWQRNMGRLMEINMAAYTYAVQHENTYPPTVDALFEKGYLKAPLKARSVLTGKPYIYAAAGEKVPQKSKDRTDFVVLYDDYPNPWGMYECVFASWVGSVIRPDDLQQQLRRRGK